MYDAVAINNNDDAVDLENVDNQEEEIDDDIIEIPDDVIEIPDDIIEIPDDVIDDVALPVYEEVNLSGSGSIGSDVRFVDTLSNEKAKSEVSGPKGRYSSIVIARDLPEYVNEPQPLLPSLDGFLVYRGINWFIKDTTNQIAFTNSCPLDYFVTFIMVRGHTSSRFRTLVNYISYADIKGAFNEIIALGGSTDISVRGLATRDNRLKTIWAQLVYGSEWKSEIKSTRTATRTTYDMIGGPKSWITQPLWPISSIYLHHSCGCSTGKSNPDSSREVLGMTPAILNEIATTSPASPRKDKRCKRCHSSFKYERISVNRDNLFIYMNADEKSHLKRHQDWPVEIQITDYDSYVDNALFTSTYSIAAIVYTNPLNDLADVGHTVAILRFNERFYYYNDMTNDGKIRDLPPQHILDILLSTYFIENVIYVRK